MGLFVANIESVKKKTIACKIIGKDYKANIGDGFKIIVGGFEIGSAVCTAILDNGRFSANYLGAASVGGRLYVTTDNSQMINPDKKYKKFLEKLSEKIDLSDKQILLRKPKNNFDPQAKTIANFSEFSKYCTVSTN